MTAPRYGRQERVRGGRVVRHVIKVTVADESRLQALAAAQRVSVARLLVESALAGDGWTITQRRALVSGWLAARRQLSGIAVNVNQVAHWCNREQAFTRDAERLVLEVERAVERLEAAVGELARP